MLAEGGGAYLPGGQIATFGGHFPPPHKKLEYALRFGRKKSRQADGILANEEAFFAADFDLTGRGVFDFSDEFDACDLDVGGIGLGGFGVVFGE